MPNAPARLGTISAPSVSIRPSFRTMRNVGIMMTWNGIISVASTRMNDHVAAEELDPRERVARQAAEQQVARDDHHA